MTHFSFFFSFFFPSFVALLCPPPLFFVFSYYSILLKHSCFVVVRILSASPFPVRSLERTCQPNIRRNFIRILILNYGFVRPFIDIISCHFFLMLFTGLMYLCRQLSMSDVLFFCFFLLLQKGTLLVYSPSQRHLGSIMLIRIQHPELVSTQFTIPTLVSLLMSSFIILLDCSHFFVFFLSFSPIQKSVVV